MMRSVACSRDQFGIVPVSTSVLPASGPSEGAGPSSTKRSPSSRRSAIRARMRSSSSCVRIEAAIFSPIPEVCSISSGEAASSESMSRKRWAMLRPVTSPTSSIPSANSTRANGRCYRGLDRRDQVPRRDLPKALQLEELPLSQPVKVAGRLHQITMLQHRHLLLAQPVDVHRTPRDEVLQQLPRARGTVAVWALRKHLVPPPSRSASYRTDSASAGAGAAGGPCARPRAGPAKPPAGSRHRLASRSPPHPP